MGRHDDEPVAPSGQLGDDVTRCSGELLVPASEAHTRDTSTHQLDSMSIGDRRQGNVREVGGDRLGQDEDRLLLVVGEDDQNGSNRFFL